MIGILQGLGVGFVVLSLIYLALSVYFRSLRRENLEERFDAGGIDGDREAFIAAGMAEYAHSLRRKLILLVYVIPAIAVPVIIYLVNRN